MERKQIKEGDNSKYKMGNRKYKKMYGKVD